MGASRTRRPQTPLKVVMIRPGTIQELVDNFVAGILDVIEEARSEHRAAALARASASIARPLPQSAPSRRRDAARSKAAPRGGATQPKPRTGPRSAGEATASARSPARSNGAAAASAPPARPQETAAGGPVVRPQREALVLDAVRSLGQGTAAEIARQGGLPNGTAYVVLRSLLARGEVARADTARGVEYRAVG